MLLFNNCACSRLYYNRSIHTYLPNVFKTSRIDSYSIISAPQGSFYLVSFDEAFFWENGVSWKVIVFNDSLSDIYITYAFDADGDGFLEALIPIEYYNMKFFLASHDNVVLLGPSSRASRAKNLCLKDFKWEEIKEMAPVLGNDVGYLVSEYSSLRGEIISNWEAGVDKNIICKVLTPRQIDDIKRWSAPYGWSMVLNILGNMTGIYGIWDSSVWSLDWFKTLRTLIESNYLLSNVLPYHDNSVYGVSTLSRLEGADLLWAFEKYKNRKPGYFRRIYLEIGGS
ncbi:MAG: hypothetical protein V1891_00750 [bacterium]